MNQTEATSTTLVTAAVPGLVDAELQRAGTTVITKHFDFEAAHFLPNVADGHKCRNVHGHSYQIWVHATGSMHEQAGWIVDFGDLKRAWKTFERRLDHQLLNDVDGLENPTAENLAAWVWLRLEEQRRATGGAFVVSAVEVAETTDSRALFVAPDVRPWVPGHPEAKLRGRSEPPAEWHPTGGGPSVPSNASTRAPRSELDDVQARPDDRGVAIQDVGVCNVRIPIELHDRAKGRQATVATVSLSVNLDQSLKGAHLSRFLQVVRDHPDGFTLLALGNLTATLRERLGSERARAVVEFPYFITRRAPVSGEAGLLDVDCVFEVRDVNGEIEHWMEVRVPVTTLCPCSRDISDYGAHNQRAVVTIRARCTADEAGLPSIVWIEELVETAETAGSAPVYPVVKRPDERHLTMAAHDNPKFVEDVARDVAGVLNRDGRVVDYSIRVESEESIHSHNAFAFVTGDDARSRQV